MQISADEDIAPFTSGAGKKKGPAKDFVVPPEAESVASQVLRLQAQRQKSGGNRFA